MILDVMDSEASRIFNHLCRRISQRGRGLTLDQLGDARALAIELRKEEPDEERVELFRRRLGFEEGELTTIATEAHDAGAD